MLNLTTANPVSWPTAPSTAVPPVPAIAAIQPLPGAGRDPQTGLGAGQDRPGAQKKERERPAPGGAPLLPRGQDEAPAGGAQPAAVVADAAARKAADAAAAALAEEQANAKEDIQQRLQEVLSTVWQASAAVVDRALGHGSSPGQATAGDGTGVSGVPPRRALLVQPAAAGMVQAVAGPVPAVVPAASTPAPSAVAGASLPHLAQPPALVAYDERGNGSVQPPEAGGLLSRRV